MKVFKVYNATTDMWLDRSRRTFYAHAVYGTSFSSQQDAIETARVTDACWAGHKLQVIAIDIETEAEREERDAQMAAEADAEYDRAREECGDPYEAAGESRFGLPGGGSL